VREGKSRAAKRYCRPVACAPAFFTLFAAMTLRRRHFILLIMPFASELKWREAEQATPPIAAAVILHKPRLRRMTACSQRCRAVLSRVNVRRFAFHHASRFSSFAYIFIFFIERQLQRRFSPLRRRCLHRAFPPDISSIFPVSRGEVRERHVCSSSSFAQQDSVAGNSPRHIFHRKWQQ